MPPLTISWLQSLASFALVSDQVGGPAKLCALGLVDYLKHSRQLESIESALLLSFPEILQAKPLSEGRFHSSTGEAGKERSLRPAQQVWRPVWPT